MNGVKPVKYDVVMMEVENCQCLFPMMIFSMSLTTNINVNVTQVENYSIRLQAAEREGKGLGDEVNNIYFCHKSS